MPYQNFAKSSNKNNSGPPPESHAQSRNERGRDWRNDFPNENIFMGRQEAKERSDHKLRIQGKGKDEKRESTSSPYDSLYLMGNDAIPEIPRHQNLGVNGSETSSPSPWAPPPRAALEHRQPSTRWSPWGTTLTAPDLAGESAQKAYFGQLAARSIMNAPEKDGVLMKSKAHHSNSGEDSIEPTRRGWPVQFEYSMDESEKEEVVSGTSPLLRPIDYTKAKSFDVWATGSQFFEATSTITQENANEGSWTWPPHALSELDVNKFVNNPKLRHDINLDPDLHFNPSLDGEKGRRSYTISSGQSSTSINPYISSQRYSEGYNPTSSPRGYYRSDFSPYFPSATERRKLPSERYRRSSFRHGPTPLPRRETFKRGPRPRTTSERIYSTDYEFKWSKEVWIPWGERIRQRRRGLLTARPCGGSYVLYPTSLCSKNYVPMETEDVPFQYQDPRQTLLKAQHNGSNSRGRILAQRRKKRSLRKATQHNPLDSSLDHSASAEKRSREDESPSRAEPQLIGRHKLSDWKLQNGKSKDWRRKPSAKTLTARQFLTAIHSQKQLHCSTVHAEDLEMAGFSPDLPVAAQRSSRGTTSMVVRNYLPAFLPRLDRKGFRDMGMKRDRMRNIFDEGEFEVEAHRKLGLRPELPAGTNRLTDFSTDSIESNRQLQLLQACPSPKISQDANPPHCLQVHYIDRVIPSPSGFIQLSEHIESSAHAEVYKICYLDNGYETFARIYTLRGIHPNQRKGRVENLKKFSHLKKLRPAFDWEGKKVCVFSSLYKIEYMSLFAEVSTPKAAGIGAIGRRNTKEYDAAFPPLPPSTPIPVPTKFAEVATEPLTPEQQLRIKTLEVIKSEIEETSPKRWKSISKEPLPLAQRLMIRLMDLNGESVAKRDSELKVRDFGVLLKYQGNRKWNEDGEDKDLEVKIKKKRGRKKKKKMRKDL